MAGIVGLILAGGLSRRMGGGDKALTLLAGTRVLDRVAARLAPQVDLVLLNANGDPARLDTRLTVVPDALPDHPGPLAGLLAGLDYVAANRPGAEWVLSVPSDSPFLPADLALRLVKERRRAPAAVATSGGRLHPVVGLWRVSTRTALRRLLDDGERRVMRFAEVARAAKVTWPSEPYDPFFNLNVPEDVAAAEAIARAYPDA